MLLPDDWEFTDDRLHEKGQNVKICFQNLPTDNYFLKIVLKCEIEINKHLMIHIDYPNLFKNKIKFLNNSTSIQIKKYFTYYFNRLEYKKINNNDNLILKK